MKILVTGCGGFIGFHLTRYLHDKGFDVFCIDSFERSNIMNIKDLLNMNIKIFCINIEDCNEVFKIRNYLSNVDCIIHSAAYIDAFESLEIPEKYCLVNTCGTANLLKLSIRLNVSKFIYLSSAAVYGHANYLPIDENHPINPINPYGASKYCGEVYVKTFSNCYNLNYIILRIFNAYGSRQNPQYAGVIVKTIERILKNEKPIIYGNGEQTRDFIHIQDIVNIIYRVIESDIKNEVFNLGFGKPIKIKDIVYKIINLMNVNIEPIYEKPRPGDIKYSYANINKLKSILNYEPKIDIDEGLKKVINWYRYGIE